MYILMRIRRLDALVVFIISKLSSILISSIPKKTATRYNLLNNFNSKSGDSGVMVAWKPVELQERVQFSPIALSLYHH